MNLYPSKEIAGLVAAAANERCLEGIDAVAMVSPAGSPWHSWAVSVHPSNQDRSACLNECHVDDILRDAETEALAAALQEVAPDHPLVEFFRNGD